jgi:hypothetical protein
MHRYGDQRLGANEKLICSLPTINSSSIKLDHISGKRIILAMHIGSCFKDMLDNISGQPAKEWIKNGVGRVSGLEHTQRRCHGLMIVKEAMVVGLIDTLVHDEGITERCIKVSHTRNLNIWDKDALMVVVIASNQLSSSPRV